MCPPAPLALVLALARSVRRRTGLREPRQPGDEGDSDSLVSSQDLIAYVRDFPGAGRASAFATFGSRATAAARADDPGWLRQGVLDPRDVEYVRDGAQRLCHRFWNARFATALHAILE